MRPNKVRWLVQLSAVAQADFREIIVWTEATFGGPQADAYSTLIEEAIRNLKSGPFASRTRSRPDLGQGTRTLHVSRGNRKARHLIVFRERLGAPVPTIEVIRILHDAMNIARHVPAKNGD